MADVWWIVHSTTELGSGLLPDYSCDDFTLVEFRDNWPDAKRRFEELKAGGADSVDVFDADGELVRSLDSVRCCWGHMSAPRVAGLYRWNEGDGHVRVGLSPAVGWRRTVGQHNAVRTGLP